VETQTQTYSAGSLFSAGSAWSAGERIARQSLISTITSAIVATFLIVATIVATAVGDRTFELMSQDGTGDFATVSSNNALAIAWQNLYGSHLLDGIGRLFLWVPFAITAYAALAAWTHLIDIHRSGSIAPSIAVTSRVASASLWPVFFCVLALCLAGIVTSRYWLQHPEMNKTIGPPPWALVIMPGIPLSGLLTAAWVRSALQGAIPASTPPAAPPRCEGCGYDLTHRPTNGLCPECGLSMDSSLGLSGRRPGSRWEISSSKRSWLRTIVDIIIDPRGFYSRLQLRTPVCPVQRFAGTQFALIGVGAWAWLVLVFYVSSRRLAGFGAVLFFPIAAALWAAFVGWGLHRLIGGLVFSDWLRKKALPDFSWARKVFLYESAYLWVFCLFNGLFFSSIFLSNGPWLTNLTTRWLGHRLYVLGIPPEQFVTLTGNALLCLLWIRRYYVALATIRWSNF
jgi:hypothetical protein